MSLSDDEEGSDPTIEGEETNSAGDGALAKLTDSQRERMERNRAEAKARLLAKKQQQSRNNMETPPEPPKKRKRTEQEMRDYEDLQNVASTGQVVRVHGTKLIDTGGGFLLEESDFQEQVEAEKVITREPAALVPTDCPNCDICGKEFSTSFLLLNYDENICDRCRDPEQDSIHSFITRTDAKQEYLLKDAYLDKREPQLKYLLRPNPHNSRWGDMKLYLRLQIERRAIEVWGSLEEIEKQLDKREEAREQTKTKKYNKKMKSLRMSARSSLYTKDVAPHQHTWGDESYDDDEDMYSHTCTDCGQTESFEKL
jgi:DNA-repair protein complementing XP-A cells